jgi:hypothetical protein
VVARDIAPLLEAATPELAPVTRPAEAAAPSGGADDNEESNPAAQLSLF